MACCASEAELETFLGRLNADYSQFASSLWQKGVKTTSQLANARESILLACVLPELYIDDIKATADRTDSLWDILWQAVPDEAHKTRAFSQTVPNLGWRTADTVGKWTAFADEVLQWVKDIGLEAILDKVIPQTPVRSQLYVGSNDLQKVRPRGSVV